MFSSLIRAQSTTLLRCVQNVQYPIQALTTAGHGSVRQNHSHTPDSYSKEVDYTPARDDKIYRVDPDSDRVQKPYEAPSGEWSRAGVKADEYRNVDKSQPYVPGGGEGPLYARKSLAEDKGTEMSNEGPDGKPTHGQRG